MGKLNLFTEYVRRQNNLVKCMKTVHIVALSRMMLDLFVLLQMSKCTDSTAHVVQTISEQRIISSTTTLDLLYLHCLNGLSKERVCVGEAQCRCVGGWEERARNRCALVGASLSLIGQSYAEASGRSC